MACRMKPKCELGRLDSKRRLVLALRGWVQIAGRLLDTENQVVVWMTRPHHGTDDVRSQLHDLQSAVATARRFVRSNPGSEGPTDSWPGCQAEDRSPSNAIEVEPH